MTLLSVLIPAYNERYTIEPLLEEVLRSPLPHGTDKEVLVVDDGSTDGTRELLQQLVKHLDFELVLHEKNSGKGAAVRSALAKARGDIAVIQDADLEYSPTEYPKLIQPILEGKADVVYGSRFLSGRHRRVLFFWHTIGNRFLTMLSNMVTNLNLTDMETCYKAFRTGVLEGVPLRSRSFTIEPELTAKFAQLGCRIYEVPISYHGRTYAEGKKISARDGFRAIAAILRYGLFPDIGASDNTGHAVLDELSGTPKFNRWMADTIRPWVGHRVVEVGSGAGNLTRHFVPRDAYYATDIDTVHLQRLNRLFEDDRRIEVAALDIERETTIEVLGKRFDTAIMLNVLEHIGDHNKALHNIRQSLEPGGRAIILVPRGPWLFSKLDTKLGHHRRYTPTTLRQAIETAGLELKSLKGFNAISTPAWLVSAKLMGRTRLGGWPLAILNATTWLWRRIDRFLPWPSLSLVAIASRESTEARLT